jgi:hypothetical protein
MLQCKKIHGGFTFIDNIRVIFSILCDMIFFAKIYQKSAKLVEFTLRGKEKENP